MGHEKIFPYKILPTNMYKNDRKLSTGIIKIDSDTNHKWMEAKSVCKMLGKKIFVPSEGTSAQITY